MSRPLNAQIIEKARSLIEDEQNWCRGELARDGDGTPVCPTHSRAKRRCALGAFIAAAYEITTDFSLAHDLAFGAVRSFSGITTLVNINDVRGHAAVLKQLDDAMDDGDQGMLGGIRSFRLAYDRRNNVAPECPLLALSGHLSRL